MVIGPRYAATCVESVAYSADSAQYPRPWLREAEQVLDRHLEAGKKRRGEDLGRAQHVLDIEPGSLRSAATGYREHDVSHDELVQLLRVVHHDPTVDELGPPVIGILGEGKELLRPPGSLRSSHAITVRGVGGDDRRLAAARPSSIATTFLSSPGVPA